MKPDKLSDNWLFQQHSKKTIATWVEKLRYFSFTRAWSAYANDGDAFRVAFMYTGKQDLIDKLSRLGLTLNSIEVKFPTVSTEPNTLLTFEKRQVAINRFKYLAQPGHSMVFGHKAFIWISDNFFSISVAGNKDDNFFTVSEDNFRACLDLEKHFDTFNWSTLINKENEKHIYYISKKKYPELFTQQD